MTLAVCARSENNERFLLTYVLLNVPGHVLEQFQGLYPTPDADRGGGHPAGSCGCCCSCRWQLCTAVIYVCEGMYVETYFRNE